MSGASDIIRTAQLAWEIYHLGWSEELNASQQYLDFGNDVKSLAENLNNILRVVENAKATWTQQSLRLARSRGLPAQRDWDLSSLHEIIGDYTMTLRDCQKLLEENHEFRKNRNFAYNIEWNLVIQPKVDHLRKKLESHNSKISILLRPLELNLLSDIHRDLADRIDAVHRSILHLQGLLIPDVEQALSEQGNLVTVYLDVPAEIERNFQTAAERSYPEIRTAGNFPLQAGADALVAHFEESTRKFTAKGSFLDDRKPPPKQYLALLKCVWIMRCLLQCDALRNSPKDSQWPGYVQQLNEDLSMECQRFTAAPAQRLVAPDLSGPRHEDEYAIWPGENIADYISPHFELVLDEVLKFPMPSPSGSLSRDMTIYRLGSNKYRLLESIQDKNTPSARHQEFKMEIDLKTVNFTPLYAVPSSRPKALEVLINSPTAELNPTFLEAKHLLRLQHLLTGYKVHERYDQAMVTVSFFISGQDAPIEEHGRLQLWLPHHFGNTSTTNSVVSSVVTSQAGSIRGSLNTAMDNLSFANSSNNISSSRLAGPSSIASFNTNRNNPGSGTPRGPMMLNNRAGTFSTIGSSTLNRDSIASDYRERSTPSRQTVRAESSSSKWQVPRRPVSLAPSTMTTSSTTSRTSVSTITTISTGTGKAHVHTKPAKPMLVIFLKSKDSSGKLAIVAIQIDDDTKVERERCLCRTSNSKCVVSCIERSKGHLLAQRWNADQKLTSWNLAKLGVEQRKDLPANAYEDVKRVSMKFDSLEDRYKFSGSPCSCKPHMQHDLSRCILEGHHGVFGVVKQIGSQRLRNYHVERDKSAGRNIVLGSLPEDEPEGTLFVS